MKQILNLLVLLATLNGSKIDQKPSPIKSNKVKLIEAFLKPNHVSDQRPFSSQLSASCLLVGIWTRVTELLADIAILKLDNQVPIIELVLLWSSYLTLLASILRAACWVAT